MAKNADSSTILIVDDEEVICALLSSVLTMLGHTVSVANTLGEALKQISRVEFDLLILDKNLPDGSGLDIIEAARKHGGSPEAIVVTAYSDTDSAIQAINLGIFRYVRKPFNLDMLKADIAGALETGRLRRDLARHAKELEKVNKDLLEALNQARESEQQKRQSERLATIGSLAAGVAHEINNPLSLLSMTIPFAVNELNSLRRKIDEIEDPAQLKPSIEFLCRSLDPTQEAVEFLMRLASDLHSLGRTEVRKFEPVKIAEIVRWAMRLTRHQLKHKTRIEIDIPDEITVNGQAGRLVQVFINLLTNAARAIQQKDNGDNWVKISGTAKNKQAVISVSDTGVGIPEENLDRIFERFFTSSELEDGRGSGIGLALVQEIIREHHGTISVSSSEGKGATFTVRLPLIAFAQLTTALALPVSDELIHTKLTILFVDSEEENLSAFEKSFGQMHEVYLLNEKKQVHALLDNKHDTIDAIVCELLPPDTTQAWLYKETIKRWPKLKSRFVFLGNPGKISDEARANGLNVIHKPVRPAGLLAEIYKLSPHDSEKPKAISDIEIKG